MKHWFICPTGLEPWDHSRPEGIAGSETCVSEISSRLASRGHDVTVYAPIFPDTQDFVVRDEYGQESYRVKWRSASEDIPVETEPGVWWICRSPAVIDYFPDRHDQIKVLRCDDCHYEMPGQPPVLTPERYHKFDHIMLMSDAHLEMFRTVYPFVEPQKCSTLGCGINVERMRTLHAPARDDRRLNWVSSPDRGLEQAIAIFHDARRRVRGLNLHVYYGWDGVIRASGGDENHPLMQMKARVEAMNQTGITWHGRVSKQELWNAHLSAAINLYPTTFTECGYVSGQEAQALGSIPICPPLAGVTSIVRNGVFIQGDPRDPVIHNRYVAAIERLVNNPELCEELRAEMVPWARQEYDWEKVIDRHEQIAQQAPPLLVKTGLAGSSILKWSEWE